jgi:signal transduction histidine kinase
MKNRSPFDLERILNSWWGRGLGVLVLVVAVSLVESVPRMEITELRGREVDRFSIFLDQFYIWAAWGLLVWPVFLLGAWILRFSGSWLILLLVQIPLSGAVAWGVVLFDHELRSTDIERMRESGRRGREGVAFSPPPGPPPPEEDQAPSRRRRGRSWGWSDAPRFDSPFWRARWLRSVLIYWAILGLGAGLHSFLENRRKDRRTAELELRTERLRTQLARAQMASLQSQLHPHFLFNALHSVGGLIRSGDDGRAVRILAAIGGLLRSTLDHGEHERVPLSEEWLIAERYLEIEGIRLGERLTVEIEADPEVQDVMVPALMLLPLVENAVSYGIAPRPEGGRVTVAARKEGARVVIEVSDDGPGFPAAIQRGESAAVENGRRSIGIQNTRERLRAIYGDEQGFELLNPAEGGAIVRIVLPCSLEGSDDDGRD